MNNNLIKVNCPIFRRLFARFLDFFFCSSIILLFGLLLVSPRLNNENIKNIYLIRSEMIAISLFSLVLFIMFFIVIPIFLNGRTMSKYFLNIHVWFQKKKKYQYELFFREFFIVIMPMITTSFIPLAFSEFEFQELFKSTFITNWNESATTLPFRISFFTSSSLYLVSLITLVISKEKKTVYDYLANTWIFIYKKMETKEIMENKKKIINFNKKRPGEIIIDKAAFMIKNSSLKKLGLLNK